MARINIEDSLFKDQRFTELCIKLGSRPLALGWLVEAWILAQEHVSAKNPTGKISVEKWESRRMNDLIIDVGLATVADRHVELAGSDKSFNWLTQRQEAASKGGVARAKKMQDKQLEASRDVPTGSRSEAGLCPPTLPLTLSLNKKDLTEYTTHVEEGGTGETAATDETPNHPPQRFKIHPDLADESINDILATIAPTAQTRWIRVYKDPNWVRDAMKEAISFYTARGDDLTGGWGVVLHKALDRAWRARLKANGGRSDPWSHNDPKFWAQVFGNEAGK